MKTTVDIGDELLVRAKRHAKETGRPLQALVELSQVRHLTGDMDLEFVGPTVPVLFRTRPIVGFEACRVKVTVFRLGSKNPGRVERIDIRVLEQQPEVI